MASIHSEFASGAFFGSSNVLAFRGFSDGGVRNQASWATDGSAACGWVLQGAVSCSPSSSDFQWVTLIRGRIFLGSDYTSFEAELHGAEALAQSLFHLLHVEGVSARVIDWFNLHLN
eukprot:gnl/MRDRNA2_/MRDRNA2_219635_c0_seq1.p1 gnl/MRDRNA2_/MRDRNA2_219635_c0~~gnl/MRDRNA2_/MRDRNA2_219635_c0_seq1.p1  ORF type:complete len:117 (+),score=9.52 gnl/MRDRNA2_/MRDRNA2_219635_c0_seq1:97-447(+)